MCIRDRNIPKEDIYVVSIMPCTAKKGESERIEMQENGIRDVEDVYKRQIIISFEFLIFFSKL